MSAPNTMRWTTPAEIKARLRRRWERGDILSDSIAQTTLYPLRLSIKGPTSGEIAANFAAVQAWVASWRQQSGIPTEWKSVGHRLFGANELPNGVVFSDSHSLVRCLGMQREWETFQTIVDSTRVRFPSLLPWLGRRSIHALNLAPDWERILSVVDWVKDHPHSGRYLRQVDLPGIHTKFIEEHRGVIAELLDLLLPPEAIDASARGTTGFIRRYGFRDKPERIRLRFLDKECAIEPARLGLDLTITAEAFAQLNPPVSKVFITENEINFLAFPDCPRSLIIFGSGYGWAALQESNWLHQCDIHYWGDIDTHGFSILDQLRSIVPHARSFLMDLNTFESYRHLCSNEPQPSKWELHRLSPEERAVYDVLRREGKVLRLEQERIQFSHILEALSGISCSCRQSGQRLSAQNETKCVRGQPVLLPAKHQPGA